MWRWTVPLALVVAAVGAGFAAFGGLVAGYNCEDDGAGGANCDVIVGVGYGLAVLAVVLLVLAVVALRSRGGRNNS
jgi:hypothetical protein